MACFLSQVFSIYNESNNTMKTIENLSSLEGRSSLKQLFIELRFEKQLSSLSTIAILWRICTQERDISKFSKKFGTIVHPLGFWSGTTLWLQEVISRYYHSTFSSFVYLGAALLLVLIGFRRISDTISDSFVIAGIVLESFLLVIVFILMLFAPTEDGSEGDLSEDETKELLADIGEIATDFANATGKLDRISSELSSLVITNEILSNKIQRLVETNQLAVAPNTDLLGTLRENNKVTMELSVNIADFIESLRKLKQEEVAINVRQELEKYLTSQISK